MNDKPKGWLTWFDALPMRSPHIEIHDSGLIARHDCPCPVCGQSKAIYHIDDGTFHPCGRCHRAGWELRKPRRWIPSWLRNMQSDKRMCSIESHPVPTTEENENHE